MYSCGSRGLVFEPMLYMVKRYVDHVSMPVKVLAEHILVQLEDTSCPTL